MAGERPVVAGIDLGTTNSAIAYLDDHGKATVIPNGDNERITPSVVLFQNGEAIVGRLAKNSSVSAPDHVVQFIKRSMGEEGWKKTFDGKEYTPETLSALILKKLGQDAEKSLQRPIKAVVVTVPAYFNEPERKATEDAGRIAGLNVISLLNEPTAAALAYGLDRLGTKKKVMVYDLGGGTFDVTIIDVDNTKIEVLATAGERKLGGIDWDDELIKHVAEKFQAEHGFDPREDLDAYQDLRNKCEEAKMALSKLDSVKVICQARGQSLKLDVSRKDFEELTKGLLGQTETYLGVVLEKATLTWNDIDTVLLSGGSTRMPMVSDMIRRVTSKEPDATINPDECVAMGAAYYGGVLLLENKSEEIVLPEEIAVLLEGVEVTNVNSHSLGIVGIRKSDGKTINHIMIPEQTALPAEKAEPFGTAYDNQTSVQIRVVEGESDDPEDCVEIGTCHISDLPAGRSKGAIVDVTYQYSADGRLEVIGRDRATGKEAKVEIVREVGMTEKQVKQETAAVAEVEVL